MAEEDLEGYIAVPDAAARMGRSTEQVRRYLREGKLEGRRIGGQWFIKETGVLYKTREQGKETHMADTIERRAIIERILSRGEMLRARWDRDGVVVDAAALVREIRNEER